MIQRVEIKALFGKYDYTLPVKGSPDSSLEDVVILYGDNGSGKTTILNLIFHMLSAAGHRGHRNALARISFASIRIEMRDGLVLLAERTPVDVGAYDLSAQREGEEAVRLQFKLEGEGGKLSPPEKVAEYFAVLAESNLLVYFLTEDREILSDALSEPEEQEYLEPEGSHRVFRISGSAFSRIVSRPPSHMRRAINLANGWISRQVVQGSTAGADSANAIYTDIVRRIAKAPWGEESDISSEPERLTKTLSALAERNERFAQYRFTAKMNVDELIQNVAQSSPTARGVIARILEPYVDSLKARLDALASVQRLTEIFIESFNGFYTDKYVAFDLSEGLVVYSSSGEPIDTQLLSSGERQLLYLFCYTVVSRDQPSIFIIDEPELSLNVKWQRKLIDALRHIVEGSDNQFLFATHSMELIAQHRQEVCKLEPQKI